MAKKTAETIQEEAKRTAERITDAAASVKEAATPVVAKAKKAAAPTVKKAAEAGKAVKEAAKKATPKKPEYYVQYLGKEINMEELANQAKAAFRAENKRGAILSCRIYLKLEDNAAYYVVNDNFCGRIDL